MNQRLRALLSAAMIAVLSASSPAAAPPADSAHADAAKAKLAALRARIADLTGRMASQLAQRDSLSALQAELASLASQARAAYMIGRQEELKLLLNQSNPASLGRTLTYYGYFAAQRSQKIKSIQDDETRLQQLVAQIEQQSQELHKLQDDATQEIAGLQHARAERTV